MQNMDKESRFRIVQAIFKLEGLIEKLPDVIAEGITKIIKEKPDTDGFDLKLKHQVEPKYCSNCEKWHIECEFGCCVIKEEDKS